MELNQNGRYTLGDVIVEIEGNTITNSDDLLNALEQHMPGDTVKVVTDRNAQRMEFDVVLAAPEAQ